MMVETKMGRNGEGRRVEKHRSQSTHVRSEVIVNKIKFGYLHVSAGEHISGRVHPSGVA